MAGFSGWAPIIFSGGVQYIGLLELDEGYWIAAAFPTVSGERIKALLIVKEDEKARKDRQAAEAS